MTAEEPTSTAPSGSIPDDPRALAQGIERTREQLGETMEKLVARVDVRAQARQRATEISGRVKGQAREVKDQPGPPEPQPC
jgi:hypothetical protein